MKPQFVVAVRKTGLAIAVAAAFLYSNALYGASFGNPGAGAVQSSATVCLSVGAQASLTGFDDIQLQPRSTDGPAGSIYEGSDQFQLDANVPVRVTIDAPYLSNGEDEVVTLYSIDGSRDYFDTSSQDGVHSGSHSLLASAQLGRISQQAAGDYSATVMLTVTPQVGGVEGCGQFTQAFATGDEWVTLVYEDSYPGSGDGDYNDMVVRYHVQENYNSEDQLETVSLQFEPLARGTSNNHSFNLSLDGIIDRSKNITAVTQAAFVGDALISVTYNHENGSQHSFHNYDKEDDITIFHNTNSALDAFANVSNAEDWVNAKFSATVNITLANPELNLHADRGDDSLYWYRPFLSVMGSNSDIDLAQVNDGDGMITDSGDPLGLLVPTTFEWPLESVNIRDAYPHFGEYTRYLNGETDTLSAQAEQWYNYPADATLVINLD